MGPKPVDEVDLPKIGVFYRWMEQLHVPLDKNLEKAIDVFSRIYHWGEEEIRAWSVFLANEGKLRSARDWPVLYLARQQSQTAAEAMYGWYLARGMHEDDLSRLQDSFHHVPWLHKAEEDFLWAGGVEGFALLLKGKFDDWLDCLGDYDRTKLGKFLWFAHLLTEEQCIETARRFPELLHDLIFCRAILWNATNKSQSPDWLKEDILRKTPDEFCLEHPWVIPLFYAMGLSLEAETLSQISLPVLLSTVKTLDNDVLQNEISKRAQKSEDPWVLMSVWDCLRRYSHGNMTFDNSDPGDFVEFLDKNSHRITENITAAEEFFRDLQNMPSGKTSNSFEQACSFLGGFSDAIQNSSSLSVPDLSLFPNGFIAWICFKTYAYALDKTGAIYHEIATKSLETTISQTPQLVKYLERCNQRLALLPQFDCLIIIRFNGTYSSFECEIRGRIEGDGFGIWSKQKNISELTVKSDIAGALYAKGEREFAIYIAKDLMTFLGKLEFSNLHRIDKAPLKTYGELYSSLDRNIDPKQYKEKIITIQDLLLGLKKYISLENTALIFEGDQKIIDLPIDLMPLEAAPMATRVNIAKSVINSKTGNPFYLSKPRVLLIAETALKGAFDGYPLPDIPEKPVLRLYETLQQIWGESVSRVKIQLDGDKWSKVPEGRWDIVHIIAHGYQSDDPNNPYGIIVANSQGETSKAGGNALRKLLQTLRPQLLFLNCCRSGSSKQDPSRFYQGLLAELLISDVPCLLGFRWIVELGDSIEFCKKFYHFLKESRDPAKAVRVARENLHPGTPESLMWANPVLVYRGLNLGRRKKVFGLPTAHSTC